MRLNPMLRRVTLAILTFYFVLPGPPGKAYSVLSHEALIDAAWDPFIVPLLLSRYPGATVDQLLEAHAYAYGGCVIQDLGYYPFGNHYFSDLTHYVRTGDFIEALLADSRNINEYAFALGALSHYVADNTGHPLAVNLSVAEMYPGLRQKFGNAVTYADNPTAHIMTEFSFDVVQITGAGYLPMTYHNFVGFRVPKALLNRAFQDTYGLKLNRLFWSERLSIWSYRLTASEVIPDIGQILWRKKGQHLRRADPQIVTARFRHQLSAQNYRSPARRRRRYYRLTPWAWQWRSRAKEANVQFVARVAVLVVEVLPKVGPLRTLRFKPPTVKVQDQFIEAFDVTVSRFGADLTDLRKGSDPALPEENLDTGRATKVGGYSLADKTYAHLLHGLARQHFRGLTPGLQKDILSYYETPDGSAAATRHPKKWRKIQRELTALRAAPVQSQIASH
jgi:hypothetical protein